MWLLVFPVAIAAFVAVILIRGLLFKPAVQEPTTPTAAEIDPLRAANSLAAMVRCKTVSNRDESLTDQGEFGRFRRLLRHLYPVIHEICALEYVGDSGILYHLKGLSSENPTILMSHYDVVPANEQAWEKPAFEGIIEDGILWGRGTLDTKVTLCAIMEAAETLLSEGFVPENDIYFAFSGDEEIAGETAPAMVAEFERLGVHPGLVLDEGGAVVNGIFPGVDEWCALVGTAEKGMLDIEFSMESSGGHASAPPPHTLIGELAQAVVSVESNPFPRKLSPAAAEMFDLLGRRSTFAYRLVFANLWCFMPLLDMICKKAGGELNALIRTTCAFTMMKGSDASNVLPPAASVVANLRLATGDTIDGVITRLKSVINNSDIQYRDIYSMNPSPISETSGESWRKLKSAIEETWQGAVTSPYLMVACSDSRHYCRISNNVYRFSALQLDKEEREMIHGNNERIPITKISDTVRFYLRLMRQC